MRGRYVPSTTRNAPSRAIRIQGLGLDLPGAKAAPHGTKLLLRKPVSEASHGQIILGSG